MDLVEILKRPEGKSLEFKRDLSSPDGVLKTIVLDGLDTDVAAAYERSLSALSKAGAQLIDAEIPALEQMSQLFLKGGLIAAETSA